MTVTALYEVPLGVCTQDPDRWTTTPDDEARPCAGLARAGGCVHATPSSPRVRKGCGQGS